MSSVALAAFLFLGPPIGEFVNRFGCRLATVIGCLTCSVALALGSVAPNIIVLYLAFSLLFGVGNTFVYISAPVIITQYFSRRRSFALGFVTAGQGLGTMICGPVLQALVGLFDWRNTFLIFAGVLGFSSLTGCLINRGNQEPTSTSTQGKQNHGKFSCDLSIWKSPTFLVLLAVAGLSNFSRMVPYVHLVSVPYHFHPRRAFLKRPENFSGPKTFRGSFRVNFSGPGKRFSTRPKTPTRVVFSGCCLQRELDSDLLRT